MAAKPTIAIVGPGRLGTSLARSLAAAGYRVSQLIANTPRSLAHARRLAKQIGSHPASGTAELTAKIVWICVPDRNIAAAARSLALSSDWKGKIAFHSSGALTSRELDALRRRGASVASVHPLMTFVSGSLPSLKGVPFGMEGDRKAVAAARKLVRALGGDPFEIQRSKKTAYHAWGTFTSPLLIAALATAEQVAAAAGIPRSLARGRMLPILRQTVANYAELGAAGAFSGPIIRGDVEIVRQHLKVLERMPAVREVYLALANSALRSLPARRRRELQQALRSRGR